MASNINSDSIDSAYPVAGVDNDTQGFRDNFSFIKNNFVAAKAEIETLQRDTVKLNATNDFNGSYILDANLQGVTEKVFKPGTATGVEVLDEDDVIETDQEINFSFGHYQIINVEIPAGNEDGDGNRNITFTLAGFPVGVATDTQAEDRFAKMVVEFRGDDAISNQRLNFQPENSGRLWRSPNWPSPLLLTNSDPLIIEFWSTNGVDVYANLLGKFK